MPKTLLPQSHVPVEFSHKFGSLIKFVLGGYDRLRFRGTFRPLFSPRWMYGYLCSAKVMLKDFAKHAQSLSQKIGDAARQEAASQNRPYEYLRNASFSKEDYVERIFQTDRIKDGLICVFGAVEPCLVMTVRPNGRTKKLEPRLEQRKCLHYYHYYEDRVFGRCHVRVQSWYPFTVDICINGRAMLARQMDQQGLGYVKADNSFLSLADPVAAQKLMDQQLRLDWLAQLNRLTAQAHPMNQELIRPLFGLDYYWTSTQSEYATDLMFHDARELAKIYPSFVHHGIMTFKSPRVMRFLGHEVPIKSGRVNGRFKGELRSDRIERHEGVCLRHGAGINGIKVYDKFAQLLRVETTLNAPEVFKVFRKESSNASIKRIEHPKLKKGPLKLQKKSVQTCVAPQADKPARQWKHLRRSIIDMPRRAEVSRAANKRYLEALASTHVTEPLAITVGELCEPVQKDGYRFRAINPLNGSDAKLIEILSRGEWTINGFRNRDLQARWYPRPAQSTAQRRKRTGFISRKLRILRAHGLIKKVTGSHRYLVTEEGRKQITALLAAANADVQRLTSFAA